MPVCCMTAQVVLEKRRQAPSAEHHCSLSSMLRMSANLLPNEQLQYLMAWSFLYQAHSEATMVPKLSERAPSLFGSMLATLLYL